MTIHIRVTDTTQAGTYTFPEDVVHIGSHPPEDKATITLSPRKDVAERHGKIFWCQTGFRYLNLTDKPTTLIRAPDFEAELNIFFPQSAIHRGDQLRVGETTLEIQDLQPPAHIWFPAKISGQADREFDLIYTIPDVSVKHPRSALAIRLGTYLRPLWDRHEILRCGADWLRDTLLQTIGREVAPVCPMSVHVWQLEHWGTVGVPSPPDFCEPWDATPVDWIDWNVVAKSEATLMGHPFVIKEKGAAEPRSLMAVAIVEPSDEIEMKSEHVSDIVAVDLGKLVATEKLLLLMRDFSEEVVQALCASEVREKARQYELQRHTGVIAAKYFHDTLASFARIKQKVEEASTKANLIEVRKTLKSIKPLMQKLNLLIKVGEHVIEGEHPLEYHKLDFVAYIRQELIPEFRDLCKIQLKGPEKSIRFCYDPFSIWRALFNLIHNAVRKAREFRGEKRATVPLWVGLQERQSAGQTLTFATAVVADNGPGMESAALETIFNGQFANADGGGLGTAVVADQLRRHRGRIEVVSERGVGTAVAVLLPYVTTVSANNLPELVSLQPYVDFVNSMGFIQRWPRFYTASQMSPVYGVIKEAIS